MSQPNRVPGPLCREVNCDHDAAPACDRIRCAAHCDGLCDSGCDRAAVVADIEDDEPLEPTDLYEESELGGES